MPGPTNPITTVVKAATATAPAGPYDLTDLATVKDELKIPTSDTASDNFLSRAVTQVSAEIGLYCARVFAVETIQDLFYLASAYPWGGGYAAFAHGAPRAVQPLQLSRWPLQSVAYAVTTNASGVDTTLVDGTDFQSDPARGQLIRLNATTGNPRPWEPYTTTVVYQAGYPAIPADLTKAALKLVTQRWIERGRDPSLRSQDQPGLGTQTWWVGSIPGVKGAYTEDIATILDFYRVPVFG
jgi:hypothetical protein